MADPLRQLPDMHALLDVTESMIVEATEREKVGELYFQLYRPDPNETPSGFEVEDQLAAFEAFADAASGYQ